MRKVKKSWVKISSVKRKERDRWFAKTFKGHREWLMEGNKREWGQKTCIGRRGTESGWKKAGEVTDIEQCMKKVQEHNGYQAVLGEGERQPYAYLLFPAAVTRLKLGRGYWQARPLRREHLNACVTRLLITCCLSKVENAPLAESNLSRLYLSLPCRKLLNTVNSNLKPFLHERLGIQ